MTDQQTRAIELAESILKAQPDYGNMPVSMRPVRGDEGAASFLTYDLGGRLVGSIDIYEDGTISAETDEQFSWNMTPQEFATWLDDVRDDGLEAARLLRGFLF